MPFKKGDKQASIVGAMGGKRTKEIHGTAHFAAIGKKGGDKLKSDRGVEFFRTISRIRKTKAEKENKKAE